MKIKNEIKEKVFAQYLGCKYKVEVPVIGHHEYTGKLTFEVLKLVFKRDFDSKLQLVLKPIDVITDRDLIEVAKFVFEPKTLHTVHVGRNIIDDNEAASGLNWFLIYQYLTNKGYDLPHYLLGEKTLKEVGLAIYK